MFLGYQELRVVDSQRFLIELDEIGYTVILYIR